MAEQNPGSGTEQQASKVVNRIAPSPTYKVEGSASDYRFILRGADLVLVDSQNQEQVFMLVGNMMSMESNLRMEFSDGSSMSSQDIFERAEMPEMEQFDGEEALWAADQSDKDKEETEGNTNEEAQAQQDGSTEEAGAEQPQTLTAAILETQKNLSQSVQNLKGEYTKPPSEINTNTSRDNGNDNASQSDDNPPPEEQQEAKGQSEDDKKADEVPETPKNIYTEPPSPGQSEWDNKGTIDEMLAKPFVALTEETNSGNKTDTVTNHATPAYKGTASPNAMVQLYVDGVMVKSVQASSDGNYTISPGITYSDTTDSSHDVYVVTTRDGLTATSDTIVVDIDVTPPDVPTIDLAPESDTGTLASDNYTKDTTPTLQGENGDPDSTLTVSYQAYTGGQPDPDAYVVLGTVAVEEDGSWQYTVPSGSALSDGTYSFKVTATDTAGNTSDAGEAAYLDGVVLDTVAPAAPDIVVSTDSTNSWDAASGTDFITNDNTPEFSGKTDNNAIIRLYINGVLVGETTADGNGDWSLDSSHLTLTALTNTGHLADGTYSVSAMAVDLAGNISAPSSFAMVIDTHAPTPTVELADSSDTGASSTDNITSDDVPFLEGTSEPGSRGVLTITDPNGNPSTYNIVLGDEETTWSQQLSQLTVVGEYTASLVMEDEAGNENDPAATFTFIFNNQPPAPPTLLDLSADDTGVSNTDNITMDRTPEFTGKATPGNGVTLYLTDEQGQVITYETVADEQGNWSVTVVESLDAGTYTVEATATNTAGVESARSAPLSPNLVIDINTAAPTIDLLTDTGLDAGDMTDHVTNSPTPLFSGTAEKGGTVTVNVVNTNGQVVASTTTAVNDQGQWETGSLSSELGSGTYTVRAVATDVAGNVSAQTTLSPNLVIDRDAPSAPTVDLAQASDTGAFNSDNYTANTTPVLRGTAEPDSQIEITFIRGGVSVASYTVSANAVNGNWVLNASDYDSALTDGTYTVSVTATDHATNVSQPGLLENLIIDTQAPASPNLNLLTDSGVQNDWITNVDDVRIGGTVDPTDIVTLRVTTEGGVTSTYTISAHSGAGTFDSVTGDWSFELEGYPEGSYTIEARRTDLAGNQSIVATTETLVIDRSLDNLTISMVAEDDKGIQTDAFIITSDNNPRFHGTVDADSDIVVRIYAESATTPGTYEAVPTNTYNLGRTTNATWSLNGISPTISALADGKYRVVVEATDDAANTSQAFLDFEVDTQPPSASTIAMVQADDTGFFHDDGYTNDQQPRFEGNCEAGARVELVLTTFTGVEIESTTLVANQDGDWSWSNLSAVLNSDNYVLTVHVVDAANNVSDAATLNFTVDTVAPPPPANFQLLTDTGVQGDLITSANPVDISGTAEAGSRVSIYDGTTFLGTVQVASDGTWTTADGTDVDGNTTGLDLPAITADGVKTYSFTTTDKAGNVSTTHSTFDITLDRNAILSSVGLKASHDTGDSSTDGVTYVTSPKIEVRGEADSTVVVQVYDADDNLVRTVSIDHASATNPNLYTEELSDLDEGVYTVLVTLTDAAGNAATNASSPFVLTVDTTAPSVLDLDLTPATDSGVVGDHTTNDSSPAYSGRSEPGSHIELDVFNEDGNQVNTVTYTHDIPANASTDAQGLVEWTIDPQTLNLADGTYTVKARAVDVAGNVSSLASQEIVIDTVIALPTIKLDTASNTNFTDDNCTSDNTPTLKGTAEPNTNLVLTIQGQGDVHLVADEYGGWSYTPSSPLGDDTYTVRITSTDTAGNTASRTLVPSLIIDTQSPDAPGVHLKDTGTVGKPNASDAITNDPDLSGTYDLSDTHKVLVSLDGDSMAYEAILNPDGTWELNVSDHPTLASSITAGNHTYTVVARDLAGNTSSTVTVPFEYDIASPIFSVALENAVNTPTMSNLTADASATIGGTCDQGLYFTITANGRQYELPVTNSGTWNFTFDDPDDGVTPPHNLELVEGSNLVTVIAEDGAGNKTVQTITINLDTQAPEAPTMKLAPGFDTNIDGDNITNSSTLVLTGKTEAGSEIVLSLNGVEYDVTVDANGNWTSETIPSSAISANGDYTFTARAVDPTGNESAATSLPVTIDRTTVQPTVQLHDSTNSGLKSDNVTNINNVLLHGTAEPGSTVTISVTDPDGHTVVLATGQPVVADAATGAWSYQTSGLGTEDGQYTVTVTATDVAGNVSTPSTGLSILIDTGMDVPTIFLDPADDTFGRLGSSTDGITSGSESDQLHLYGYTDPDTEKVEIFRGGEKIGEAVIDTNDTDLDGNCRWSFAVDADTYADNTYTFTARATDAATNTASASLPITFDNTAPIKPSIDLHVDSDTGLSATDEITNLNWDGSSADPIKLSGTVGEAGEGIGVFLYLNYGEPDQEFVGRADVVNRTWSYTFEVPNGLDAIPEGTYTFTAVVEDVAGNVSQPSDPLEVVVDYSTIDPAINLVATSDSAGPAAIGGSVEDDITNVRFLDFDGDGAEPFAAVAVIIKDAQGNETVLKQTIADEHGHWEVENVDTAGYAQGEHTFYARATDEAGNVSNDVPLTVTIDTQAPVQTLPGLDAGSDTGRSSTDDITMGDDANTSIKTTHVTLRGELGEDAINDQNADTLQVRVYEDRGTHTAYLGTAEIHSEGGVNYWTLDYANITEGEHTFSIEVEDVAGNQTSSGDFTITIDRTNTGTTLALDPSTNTYGNLGSSHDLLTASNDLLITGETEAYAAVYITLNGQRVSAVNTGTDSALQDENGDWYVLADQDGSWSIRVDASGYADSTYQFEVHTEDQAGNQQVNPLSIEIDRTAPVAQNVDLAPESDLGRSGSDNITSANNIVLQGVLASADVAATGDPNKVALYVYEATSATDDPATLGLGGTLLGQAVVTGNSWTLPEFAPTEGDHYYYTRIVDNAGNETWSLQLLHVQIDHTLPESSIDLNNGSDSFDAPSGGTVADNLTNAATLDLTITSSPDTASIEIFKVVGGAYVSLGNALWNGSAWVFEVEHGDILTDGDYTFVSQATDVAGNVEDIPAATALTPGDGLTVEIDRTPPTAPSIDLLAGSDSSDAAALLGSSGDEYTNAQSLELSGTAEAGAGNAVYLFVSIDGGAETLLETYDGSETTDGAWSHTFDSSALGLSGAQTLVFRAEARDAANNVSQTTLTVHVDQSDPDKPTIGLGNLDAGSGSDATYEAIVNEDVAQLRGTLTEGPDDVIVTLYRVVNGTRTEVANSVEDSAHLTITPDGNGNFTWAYDYTYGNDDGAFSFIAKVEDKAGNWNESDVYDILVDRSITPPTLDLIAASDSFGVGTAGTNLDNITNAGIEDANQANRNLITLTGTADPDCVVQIIAVAGNGTETVLATVTNVAADSTWTMENIDVSGLTDGTHTIIARATDQAGSVADSNDVAGTNTVLNLTLDRVNSAATITLDAASDSPGHVGNPVVDATHSDNITNAQTITLRGTADLGTFVTVTDENGNQVGTASTDANGNWSISGIDTGTYGNLGQETITYTVSSVDVANNHTTSSVDVTFDKQAPSAPSIDLTAATNTGSTHDGLTSSQPVTLTGTVLGADATGVEIYLRNESGDLVYVADADSFSGGTWTYTTNLAEQTGAYTFVARAVDVAGNYKDSSDFEVTIDRSVSVPTIELDASTDTFGGPSGTVGDDYTGNMDSAGTTLNIKVSGDTDGTIAVYLLDPSGTEFTVVDVNGVSHTYTGTLVGTSTHDGNDWSLVQFNASGYQDATTQLNFLAVSTDLADNKAVAEYAMTLDDTDPVAGIIDLATASDHYGAGTTGTNADNLTNAKEIVLTGTLAEGANAVTVTVSDNGTELGQAVVTGDAVHGYKWTLVVGDQDGAESGWITEGEHNFTAVVEDNAGNTTHLSNLEVNIDRSLSAPLFSLITDSAGNLGTASDRLTNVEHLSFSGNTDTDSIVEVFYGAVSLGMATVAADGSYTFDLNIESGPYAALFAQDKEYTLTAKATDQAGNTNSTNLAITLDRTVNSTVIDLADGSDTYFNNPFGANTGTDHDNITHATSLDLSGTIDTDSTIALYIGGQLLAGAGGAGGISIDQDGNWSVTADVSSFVADGTSGQITIEARITDNAGNTTTATRQVTVDRAVPEATTIRIAETGYGQNGLDDADTGASSNDNVTQGNPLVLTGTVAESASAVSVYIYDNGVYVGEAAIAADKTWSFSYEAPEGSRSYTAVVADLAGNVSAPTAVLPVTVDRTFTTLTMNLADASDSAGIIGDAASHAGEGADNITNAATLTFNGTADPYSTVVLTIDGTGISHQYSVGANGTWSITLTPAESASLQNTTYTAEVTATDTAGNFLEESLPFTIDRAAPTAGTPSLTDATDLGRDTGDNVTYATDLVLEGSLDEGASAVRVHVYLVDADGENAETLAARTTLGQGYLGEATVATDGGDHSWTFSDNLSNMADGTYHYQVVVEDTAGNRTASAVQTVVVDTQPPTVTINLQDGSDTAGQHIGTDSDDITNAATIVLDGTTDQATNIIRIYNSDTVFDETTFVAEATVSTVNGTVVWVSPPLPATDGQDVDITYTARAENIAGLTSTADLTVTHDRLDPAQPTLSLEPDPDLGGITTLTNEEVVTLNISDVVEAHDAVSVTLFRGLGENPVEVGEATWAQDTGWTYTFDNTDGNALNDLGEGQQYFRVRVQDEAGNESWSEVIDFQVDRTVAATTITLDSDTAGGQGTTTDRLTNATVLEFSGDTDLSGDSSTTVYLVNQDGSLTAIDGTISYAPSDTNGNDFTFTATEAATAGWANGNYTFRAVTTDTAGNQSFADVTVAIDRTIATPTFALATGSGGSDTGRDTADGITSAGTEGDLLTFKGTSNQGDTVTVYVTPENGTPTAVGTFVAGDTNWTFEIPADQVATDGDYSFYVETEDNAGNSSSSQPVTVTIDRTTVAPSGLDLATSSDTFYSDGAFTHGTNTDNTTRADTITLSGTVEAGSIVRLYIDGVAEPVATQTLAGNDATWSITVPHDAIPANIDYTFYVETEDLAGNVRTYDPATDESITVTIDRAAPGRPSIAINGTEGVDFQTVTNAGDDNGVYTSDTTPTFTIGNLEPGSRLDIQVDGVRVAQPVIPENTGSYTFTPDEFSTETQSHTITILAVDAAGNPSEIGTYTFIVDTASTPPAGVDLTDASNAGNLDDNITSDSNPDPAHPGQTLDVRPVLEGTAEAGAHIRVSIGGVVGTTTADADGNWTYTVTTDQAFGEGTYSASITATDYAGNVSQAVTYEFEIDNTVAATGFAMTENALIDTGFAQDDQYTQTRTPAFNWTAAEDLTATITVYKVDGGSESVVATFDEIASPAGENTWCVPNGYALVDGEYRVEAVFTDESANVSAVETATLTIDNVGPVLGFHLNEDAGETGDWTTNGAAVAGGLIIGGTSEEGSRLYVYINDVLVNAEPEGYAEVPAGGNWTFTLPASSLTSDGMYAVKVISEDQAGNKTAETHTLTVDLSVNPVGGMSLTAASNSGTLADQITNDDTPTLTGQTEPGSTVILYWVDGLGVEHLVNNTEAASTVVLDPEGDGTWTITASSLGLADNTETDITFRAYITDRAENQTSIDHVVRIDTKPTNEANLTIALTQASDTGEVKTDSYTNDTTPNIRGGGAEANTLVEVFMDGVLLGTAQSNGDGDWVLAYPASADPLAEGDHTVTVRSYDVAGNLSEFSNGLTVTIDVTPTAPTIALAVGDDTGFSSTDMITSVSNPTFNIQLEPNSDMAVLTVEEVDADGNLVQGGVNYTFVNHEPSANGVWQPEIDGINYSPLNSGIYRVTVMTNDKAGNTATHSETLVIDKSLPAFSMVVAEDLIGNEHHGLYVDDVVNGTATHIVNSSTVTLLGSDGEPGSVITVYDGDPANGGTSVGNSVTVAEDGSWTYTFTDQDTGVHTYVVRATDQVGNVYNKQVTFTVDLVDPTTPGIVLADGDDSAGVFVGTTEDNITNVTTPDLDITFEPDTQVEIFIGNATTPVVVIAPDDNTTGTYTFSPVDYLEGGATELGAGTYSYKVVTTDRAGNTSQKTLTMTVDPEYSATLSVDLHEDSDHGFQTNDDLTNDRTPTLTGNAEAGSIVKVYISAGMPNQTSAEAMTIHAMTCVNTQTLDKNVSTWEYTPTLAGATAEVDKYYKIIVISEDAAGNTQEIVPELVIHLDTIPPEEATVRFQNVDEYGVTSEDSMTADLTPALSGYVELGTRQSITLTHIGGEVVTFEDSDVSYDMSDIVDGKIRWTLQIPEGDEQGQGAEPLLNGPYTVTIVSEDEAGNETVHEEELLVQAGDPEPPTIGLAEASDSSILLDGVTKFNGVTQNEDGETPDVVLQGYVESWKDVRIYQVDENDNATLVATVNAGGGGLWQWAIPGDVNGQVADGTYTYYVECTYRNGVTYRSGTVETEVEGVYEYENFTVRVDSENTQSAFELGEDPVTGLSYDTGLDDDWLLPGENSGDLDFSMSDWRTYYSSPTIRGNAEPGSTIQVQMLNTATGKFYDLSIIPPTTDEDGNYFDADGNYIDDGAWSYTFNTLAQGSYTVRVITTDLAGNVSTSVEQTLTIDPNLAVPSIGLTDAEDTMVNPDDIAALSVSDAVKATISAELDGFSTSDDGVTSVNNPTLTGECEDGARVKVTAYYNGSNIPCAESEVFIATGGTWSFLAGDLTNVNGKVVVQDGVLMDGSYLFKVTTVDLAGNEEVSSGLELTIDTETRSASIDMFQSSDHGPFGTTTSSYLNDNITNVARPSFRLYGDNGATYLLFLDDVLVESGTFSGTYADYTPSGDISDGDHVYKLVTADQAGHIEESASFNFTIDTMPVTVVDVPIDLVQDGGIQDDYITNVNNPTLRIQVEPGTWASISGAGFSGNWARDTDGDGYVQFTVDPALLDGSYPVTVRFSDTAGNYDTADNKTISLVIDTLAPATSLDLSTASDLGFSATDNYTASPDVLLTGAIRTNREAGATTALDDNEDFTITFTNASTGVVIATYTKDSVGDGFSFDNSTGQWSLQCENLLNATYNVTVHVQDSAGNVTNTPMNFTVFDYDNVGGFPEPTLNLVDLPAYHILLLQGSTVASTLGYEARLEMTFHNQDGSSVTVEPTAQADGTILFNLYGTQYASYDYVTMVVHDRAGNVSDTVVVDLDTSDGYTPPDPEEIDQGDDGILQETHNILSVHGTLDEEVSHVDQIRLTLHGDTDGDGTEDLTVTETVDVDGDGAWAHDFTAELSDGDYSLEITGIDTDDGNAEVDIVDAADDSYSFTVDVPEEETLDHSVSMTDGQETDPVLHGTVDETETPGVEHVNLTVTADGADPSTATTLSADVDETGSWSVDAGDLAPGDYTLNLEALDSESGTVDLQGGQEYDFTVLAEDMQSETPTETELYPETTTDTVPVTPEGGEDVGAVTVSVEVQTTTEYTPDL